jgi:hypothetical protein
MLGTTYSNFMLCMPIFDHELGAKKIPNISVGFVSEFRSQNLPVHTAAVVVLLSTVELSGTKLRKLPPLVVLGGIIENQMRSNLPKKKTARNKYISSVFIDYVFFII